MFTLIKDATLYSPAKQGKKDILVAGNVIARIAEQIFLPDGLDVRLIDASGKIVMPGFIDLHVHILGGGGEAGFGSRTPEITLSKISTAGVTTVVGCLGTDDVTRKPESLLAKAMQLEEEGVSTYIYTGSYQLPPATITGSVRKDIALIPKVVGVGEVAISDHRSSQPSFAELCRLAAEARVGGMIGGKAGVVHLHVGSGDRGLEPVIAVIRQTEIPISQFLPTHVTRTRALWQQAMEFAKMGGYIDLTASPLELTFAVDTAEALSMALEEGVPLEHLSLSSDSNGSMPIFNEKLEVVRLAVGDIGNLYEECRKLVNGGRSLEDVLQLVTVNPAKRMGIFQRKGSVTQGKDADLLIVDPEMKIEYVMARGRFLVEQGRPVVKGTFEE
ncbi:MAG: beta-aspartyl-peptidase [Deltaproteobacteria bacterium]|nr:beta-aspartyl-peptidase [Deltaproteobacteria bacterium]MBW2070807.1 beta-aspartyl-peptidase [Deltaproteobacteria bacterium]